MSTRISRIFTAAVTRLDAALDDPALCAQHTPGELTRIRLVRHAMDDLRDELETLDAGLPSRALCEETK